MLSTAAQMVKTEGWIVFWVGMNPSLMRSFSYSAIRLACYDHAKTIVGADKTPTLWRKVNSITSLSLSLSLFFSLIYSYVNR